jgi:hypothetical protein
MKRNDKATSEKTIIIIAIVKKMTAPQQWAARRTTIG